MKVKKMLVVSVAMMVGLLFGGSISHVEAAFYDRDKLGQALAVRFGLNDKDVAAFLADFQYNPEKYLSSASTPVSTAKPSATQIVNGVLYKYDDGSDKFYKSSQLVSVQHQNHLDFIEKKLDVAVKAKKLTQGKENKILDKLAEMMSKSPSSEEFEKMKVLTQQAEINKFKTEMDKWMKNQDMTLGELRSLTGKGNKYLMGIYLE